MKMILTLLRCLIAAVFLAWGSAASGAGTAAQAGTTGPGSESPQDADAIVACGGRDLVPQLVHTGQFAAMERKAAGIANGRGKFYRLEKPGEAASFLYGTMHLSDPRLRLAPDARKAFDTAETLVIETTDSLDAAAATAMLLARPDLVYLPQGRTLDDILTGPQAIAVTAGLKRLGVSPASVERLQPWFVALSLMLPACETARLAEGQKPLDLALAAEAEAADKKVLGLESGGEQLEALASMSDDLQVANLVSTLALGERLPDLFETMTRLYLSGRIALIPALAEAMLPPDSAALARQAGEFEQRLITDRNHRMAERLEPLLRGGGIFVALGALHLPGEEGLVALLRASGYRLTRLD